MARVAFADGSKLDLAPDPGGVFAFKTPDGRPYSLTFATDFQTVTYQLTASTLSLIEEDGGRSTRKPVSANTEFYLNLMTAKPNADATHHQELISTGGIWTRTSLTSATLNGARMPWMGVVPLSGQIGLLEGVGSDFDVMYYVNYVDNGGSYFQLADMGIEPHAVLANGAANSFNISASFVNATKCAHLDIDPGKESARLDLLTANGAALTAKWSIVAAPFAEYLPEVSVPIGYHNGDEATPTTTFMIPPFDLLSSTYAELEASVSGAPMLHTVVDVPLDPMCGVTTIGANELVKVPTQITVAGTQLMANGNVITADRSKRIVVQWTPSTTGAADYYVTRLVEAGTTLATVVTVDPKVSFDPELIVSGHNYSLVITARRGATAAAPGDFTVKGPTVGYGEATSTTFQIP